jgi:hypothetical protein
MKKPVGYSDEFKTIEGILVKVSSPNTFISESEKATSDYYYLGIKTPSGDRIMVYITTTVLGWSGDFNKSRIYYYNPIKKREMKTSLADPEHFIGKKIRVTGFLECLSEKERKYRMNRVQRVVLFIDEDEKK